MPIKPSTTLAEHVRVLTSGPSDFAQELDEITDKVSDTFPEHPSDDRLYILVVVSVSVGEWTFSFVYVANAHATNFPPHHYTLLPL
jgi:hypothetical protein